MAAVDWKTHYRDALNSARSAVQRPSRVACGFTNNVDIVVQLLPEALAPFHSIRSGLMTGELPASLKNPVDLGNALLHFTQRGIGGEVPILDAALIEWMQAHFSGPMQIGGTGARAANTLAFLGFPTIMHVTGLSALEAELHEPSGRLMVANDGVLLPAREAVQPGDEPMFHYIFEYQPGQSLDFGVQTITPTQANRIITSYDHLNMAVELSPSYLAAIADPQNAIDAMLVSGLTQMAWPSLARKRIVKLIEHIQRRRKSRPLLVHVELGAIIEPEIASALLEEMIYYADSLGLNIDEIPLLSDALGLPSPETITQQVEVLSQFREKVNLGRVNLHTQTYCLTVTISPPEQERQALLFAALVASARAATGQYPSLTGLEDVLNTSIVHPHSFQNEAELANAYGLRDGIGSCGGGWVVYVPTLYLEQPNTIVGLGDTYTGALLAMLVPDRREGGVYSQ